MKIPLINQFEFLEIDTYLVKLCSDLKNFNFFQLFKQTRNFNLLILDSPPLAHFKNWTADDFCQRSLITINPVIIYRTNKIQ